MTVAEYKDYTGKTNRDLTKEFKAIQPELDEPLVSRLVSGIVSPSKELQEYLDKTAEKVFANGSDEFFGENGTNYRPQDLSPLETLIFNRLDKATKYFPASRRELCVLTGLSDRMLRRTLESIRRKGGRVCTSSRHYGYWLARNARDYELLRKEYTSRIRSLAKTIRAMDGVLAGQISWDAGLGSTAESGTTPES